MVHRPTIRQTSEIHEEAHDAFVATLPAFTVNAATLAAFERATAAFASDYTEASALACFYSLTPVFSYQPHHGSH